jgi:hypothetical protein
MWLDALLLLGLEANDPVFTRKVRIDVDLSLFFVPCEGLPVTYHHDVVVDFADF